MVQAKIPYSKKFWNRVEEYRSDPQKLEKLKKELKVQKAKNGLDIILKLRIWQNILQKIVLFLKNKWREEPSSEEVDSDDYVDD